MRRLAISAVILICALLLMNVSGARSFATLGFRSTLAQAGTVYPILDARFAYAAERHTGEARLGNVGAFPSSSRSEMRLQPVCEGGGDANRCWLRFEYAFRDASVSDEFVAAFFGLGRTGVSTANPDCSSATDLDLHQDSTFDLTDLMLNAQDDKVSVEALRLTLRPDARNQTLTLRVELEDQNRRKKFARAFLAPGANPVTLNLPLNSFRDASPAPAAFDWKAVKVVSLVIEERHVVDGVSNPSEGRFDIEMIGLVDENGPRLEAGAIASLSGRELIAELARRDFESLLRLTDAKTGASLDRTLFRDLIHWGATGWLLAALPAAAGQGWISADDARQRALRILRFVDNDALWGNELIGKLGNSKGLMYRFGGIDPQGPFGPLTGARKIDANDCNAIEASVIDTALFQFGAVTCAAGFSGQDTLDQEINQRVGNILRRTRWNELVDPATGQLQLGWKPERDTTPPGFFAAPAAFGGFWASRDAQGLSPLTIDYWTDEGAMAAILAAGSETTSAGRGPWYSLLRRFGRGVGKDVVVTCPGAWFTYSFFTATYLDPNLGADRAGDFQVNWTQNAIRAFAAYQSSNPPILPDAVELPDTTYLAQGLPDLSVSLGGCGAGFTGTHTPWSLQLAIGLGGETAVRAIAELQNLLRNRPELWDPMFGFLDSYHPNLAAFPGREKLTRQEGRWVQQQVWPLNKGGALLAQLNYLANGVVWKTARQNVVIKRGVDRIYQQPCLGVNGPIPPQGSHDWWSIAISRRTILIPDGFQEQLYVFDDCRRQMGGTITPPFANAGCGSIEPSRGPAGLRDAAAHPDGGWVALIAGPSDPRIGPPSKDFLLRVPPDRQLSVLSCDFGEAMERGDEIDNFPRIAIGGSPPAILVTVNSPQQGIAVVRMDGRLVHTIAQGRRYHGVAVAPGSNRLYLLAADGAVWSYANFYDAAQQPAFFTRLPGGVGGRDLAYNSAWRTSSPNLIAVGTDGNVYAINLQTGRVEQLTFAAFLSGVWAVDFENSLAAFARDSAAWLDDGNIPPVVSAASFTPHIADKAIVAAFGSGFATNTQSAPSLPLPITLAGTTALVNGRSAPLFFVSPGQINFQIPAGTAVGDAAVTITNSNADSALATITVMATAPTIFTFNATGRGPAAAVDALTGAPPPFNAKRDGGLPNIITVFGTGLGGDATDVDNNVNASVMAHIDGNPATLLYAGRAPGFVGLNQFNVELPMNITPGDHTLTFTRGGVTSNLVTIAIR